MHRLFRLAIAMLPLSLGAAAVAAQEPPPGQHGGRMSSPPVQQSPRELRPRESLMQAQRGRAEQPRRSGQEARPGQDGRSISEAVRRVQRSTGGQILGAEQVPFEGRSITRVKYMDERGRVRYMDDPGANERRPRRADNGEP